MARLGSLIGRILAWWREREARHSERLKRQNAMEAEEHKLKVERLAHEKELYEQEAKLGEIRVESKRLDMSR